MPKITLEYERKPENGSKDRRKSKRNIKRKKQKATWIWEFSKRIVFLLSVLFVIERFYSMVVIWRNGFDNVDVFLQTGSEVFLATVVAYCLKSGFENVGKIRHNRKRYNAYYDETDNEESEENEGDCEDED